MKKAIIIGAGPAGLTAATELLRHTDYVPHIFEATDAIGGISRTVVYKGNRMDIGGHRFFSKDDRIMNYWQSIMPMQGSPSYDDQLLQRQPLLAEGGPDPNQQDNVMLSRERVSRIFFLRHFFDYPISVRWATFRNMGLRRTIKAAWGYLAAMIRPLPETSLENFYINRFGRPLYEMFFEDYTEKVWGVHPSQLGADWGSQRVKGLSIMAILRDVLLRPFRKRNVEQKNVETSLIESFIYPKYGPGQLWERVAALVEEQGGVIEKEATVTKICVEQQKVVGVEIEQNGQTRYEPCDVLFSSMPIRDLVAALQGVNISCEVADVAQNLPYRDFITVGLLVKKLKITNQTHRKTYDNRVPDTWIYVQERDVKVGRLQIFNNWSPYMVKDYEHTLFIGMEYFCTEGDELWQMSREDFIQMAIRELVKINVVDEADVLDATHVKVKKAYPAYYGTYYQLDKVKNLLDTIENLYCIGRNGQHRYNNMDHSMLTAIEAVDNLRTGKTTKENVWSVNTEGEYHESKSN